MSKTTLSVLVGAAAGISATALYFKKTAVPTLPTPPPASPSAALRRLNDPVDPAGLFQYGFPGPINDLATRHSLVSGYDRRTRNPSWVAEHITRESLAMKNGDRQRSQFVEDDAIPEQFRAKLKDYYGSGFDRGHQVPAADAKFSQEAMDETFYLSNMCPQVGSGFNRDYWAHFEDFCRRLTTKYPSVRVVTGPLYLPRQDADGKWRVSYEVIGTPPNVAVPTHFYKVIVAEGGSKDDSVATAAFVVPNAVISNDTKLTEFLVGLPAVERASGLEFLSKLPENRKKQLCKEIECSITVREFDNSRKALTPKK